MKTNLKKRIRETGGRRHSSRRDVFKEGLQNEIGVKIRITHYPSYTSTWNPIEHRVFSHVTRAMQGVILVIMLWLGSRPKQLPILDEISTIHFIG